MNAVKVDDTKRVRLPMLNPGDYYVPEIHGESEVLLRKIQLPKKRMSRAEVLQAIDSSPIKFQSSWDELKDEVR
ncbi:MAG: hypothetical protein ACREFE_14850 [Limisphaerales bacterium]